jgi:Xaa-Pro aminopeptidase
MAEPSLVFPATEYRARVARLQAEMTKAGQDALLLTSPADVFYVTGFLTRFWESPARPWFVVVPVSGAPVAVIPAIGAELMGRCWINNLRTWDAPDPVDDGVSLLVDTVCALVPPRGRVGVPMGLETSVRMPMADYARLVERLRPRAMVDATDVVQRVREVKSAAEVEKIKAVCAVAGRAFADVPKFARAGVPLAEVFRAFQRALLAEGADWVSYVAGASGPGGYSDVISPAGSVPLASGDVLMLDTGAVRDGYFCDFDRNFAVGVVSDAVRRIHDALWEVTEDVLHALKPGLLARDVHQMFLRGLGARGVEVGGGRLGHGLGIALTEWPSFTPRDTTVLRAGMVLTLEPGAVVGAGRMLVHEENILLHDTGATLLSPRAPRKMPVLGP